MGILELKNISKSFGGLKAVNNVSLEVEEGSITGLIGPNGSGKTTLFHVILGILRQDDGKIFFMNERIDNLPPYERFKRGLVMTFQNPRLFHGMTVLENSLISPKNQRGEKIWWAPLRFKWIRQELGLAKKAYKTLDFLDIAMISQNFSSNISGGQMKLTEIARALMAEPKMLLLDEPAAGVAPKLARDIFKHIVELRDEYGLTFFIIEHRLEILFDYVDQVFVMHRGEIISSGRPDEIVKDPKVLEAYLGE
ncbi:MAG TPA: ABC transporter ATP-binding protein [Thermoprotei archaeon]|nr:ABC transporter ATP-binding protein [Thermoprotei archaeon]